MADTLSQALKKAVASVQSKVDSALANEVTEAVRAEELQQIKKEVYGKYEPRKYSRRGDMGGLADPENIVGKVSGGKLTVENVTDPNPAGVLAADRNKVTTHGKNLPGLIEHGHGWNGNKYDFPRDRAYMKPRPFTAATIKMLKYDGAAISALAAGLRRQKLQVEVSARVSSKDEDLSIFG